MSKAVVTRFFNQVKGGRPFVIEAQYGDDAPKNNGAKYYQNLGWVVDLDTADPEFVEEYAPRKYSVGDFFNGVFSGREYNSDPSEDGDGAFTLYDDQQRIQDTALNIYDRYGAGFLNASDTGTGKTITTVSTLKKTSARTILVVAPKSVLPSWRDTLLSAGDADKMWLLINYESLGKLLLPGKEEKEAKKKSTKNRKRAEKGIPILNFDVAVFDECHYMANPASLRSKMARRIAAGDSGEEAFQMWLSATYGKDPTKTTFLYPALSELSDKSPAGASDFTVSKYAALCKRLGIRGISTNNQGGLQDYVGSEAEIRQFSDLCFKGDSRFADRIESKDDQKRELLAVELTKKEMDQYDALWMEFVQNFKSVVGGDKKKAREPEGLAVQMRFRQKAGILRAPYMVDAIKDMLADGYQVAVSCEFKSTVALIRNHMVKSGMGEPAVFIGNNDDFREMVESNEDAPELKTAVEDRESERVKFQRGEKKVILFSTAEGINLQANEIAVGDPSSAPRSLLIAEPRWSPLKMAQIEGRTQRNREVSTAWYAYASGTIESKVIGRMIAGMASVSAMRGDKAEKSKGLKSLQRDVIGDIIDSL